MPSSSIARPRVSFIVTLYNKENYIRQTALSLLNQAGDFEQEFVFIDDNSTDNSIPVLEETLAGKRDVTILKNHDNRGPSVRLNQAAEAATGNFLFFFDSDDLLLPGAIDRMLGLLQSNAADFIHGKYTDNPQARLPDQADYQIVDNPCRYALERRPLTLMSALVRTEVFKQARGCDEGVFIQDLSFNLNMACASRRMIDLKDQVMIRLEPETNLTAVGGSPQAHHDGFFSYHNLALRLEQADADSSLSTLANRRAISYGWKFVRNSSSLPAKIRFSLIYILSRANIPSLGKRLRRPFLGVFSDLPGVRKSIPRSRYWIESSKSAK